ncbi:MAG TPA: acyl-CoA dehydrogenase [Micrococcales bacterium]|uniref:acyl-CoA dehydrogenase family protein n=1 Tax=Miniimonas arenae TaxID=676201 RepID=UPI000ED411A8|nr:acyl-CoA dehydrogenase family protein [Miniimonas arenae]HCX86294.1 acyl-CoA dehydrogenase [Micrococcales bacterium]
MTAVDVHAFADTSLAEPTLTEPTFTTLPAHAEDLRQLVREFAQTRLRPAVRRLDEADAADFDWELVTEAHQLGLTRLVIPRHLGGLGYGELGVAVALEELAAVDAGFALIFGATMLGQAPLLLSGDAGVQARFLPLFAGDDPVLACNAITEERAGCDLLIPEAAEHAIGVTRARREGDHYVVDGAKMFITNGKVAHYGTVFANLEGRPGASGLTCFVIPLDAPGVTRGAVADKMGYRACLGTELQFDGVRVPAENMIGGEGGGVFINIAQMNMARAAVAAIATGVARGALDLAIAWCDERVQGGKRLREHQFTARKLAEMAAKVEAARLMYLRAAHLADTRVPAPVFETATAKLFADRIAIEVAEEGMSLMGARGYVRDWGMEKYLREALGSRIYEGTPEVLALAVTDAIYTEDDGDF